MVSTLSYGGPEGRAMRQYLSDNVYATIDNIYAMVDDNSHYPLSGNPPFSQNSDLP